MTRPRGIPPLAFALAVALLGAACGGARAAVQCVDAFRYDKLVRITNGDMGRLVRGLGLPSKDTPPPEACRAVLMTGTIDAATVRDLMQAISVNRGWLAVVYLAVGDGDISAEVELAAAMRTFRLAGVIMLTDLDYTADFLPPNPPFPMSVSNGWPQTDAETKTPLADRLDDYYASTQRRIQRGTSRCQRGCGTILAGAVDRVQIDVGNPVDPRGANAPQSAAEEATRDRVRAELGLPGRAIHFSVGWGVDARLIRLPGDVVAAAKDACRARIDYAASLSTEIASEIDGYAKTNFGFMRLGDLARRSQELGKAGAAVDLCAIQVLDRQRMAAFQRLCTDRCDLRTIEAEAGALLKAEPHR